MLYFSNKNWTFQTEAVEEGLALYQALVKAHAQYITKYSVDITKVVSTSNLSLQIYRRHFMPVNIPILKISQDIFIRNSYYGGATDYYKAYGENLKYYDVNSLYPFVMKKDMPFEIIKFHSNMDNILITGPIFGFFEAEISTPQDIKHPLLPFKIDGETLYPVGNFKGVYFSEELRNAAQNGYKIKLLSGYEFSKISLFDKYVDHFYDIKRKSTGALKYISKLQLNTLYGVFGRKQEIIETINIHPNDLPIYAAKYEIKSVLEVSDKVWTILINSHIKNYSPMSNMDNPSKKQAIVKSNVAIASAVTAFGVARIYMSQFKNNDNFELLYTDTDSIMIDKLLPEDLLGKDIRVDSPEAMNITSLIL